MRRHLAAAFAQMPVEQWPGVDVTEIYAAARREVFATCNRLELPAPPGEAYFLHRLALHGLAPWTAPPGEGLEGRMVASFRPPWPPCIQEFFHS